MKIPTAPNNYLKDTTLKIVEPTLSLFVASHCGVNHNGNNPFKFNLLPLKSKDDEINRVKLKVNPQFYIPEIQPAKLELVNYQELLDYSKDKIDAILEKLNSRSLQSLISGMIEEGGTLRRGYLIELKPIHGDICNGLLEYLGIKSLPIIVPIEYCSEIIQEHNFDPNELLIEPNKYKEIALDYRGNHEIKLFTISTPKELFEKLQEYEEPRAVFQYVDTGSNSIKIATMTINQGFLRRGTFEYVNPNDFLYHTMFKTMLNLVIYHKGVKEVKTPLIWLNDQFKQKENRNTFLVEKDSFDKLKNKEFIDTIFMKFNGIIHINLQEQVVTNTAMKDLVEETMESNSNIVSIVIELDKSDDSWNYLSQNIKTQTSIFSCR